MSDGCAAPAGGVSLDGVDLAKESVIQGVVTRADESKECDSYDRDRGHTPPMANDAAPRT